jgi:hypothetical protein
MAASNSKPTPKNNSIDRDPETTTNVALYPPAKTRLTAYKNSNPLKELTFDEAVTQILDEIGFPQAEEIESKYLPSLAGENSNDSENERSNDSA